MKRIVAFVALMSVTACSLFAAAQPRRAKPAPKAAAEAGVTEATPVRDAGAEKAGAIVEQKSADGGSRVFRFGEVEVEGRLKSPQIVYFLRRVRAEFSAADLGHRSFIRELDETKTEPAF